MSVTALPAIIFIVGCLVGVAGIILPGLPGVPITAATAFIAAGIIGFDEFGLGILVWVLVLTIVSQVAEYIATVLGAKGFGASRAGVWGGVIGSILGLIFFPPVGFLLGAMLGATGSEYLNGRTIEESLRSGLGALIGTLGSIVAKMFILVAICLLVFPRLL